MVIGIIGQGFVGNAVFQKFKNFFNVLTFDIDKSLCDSTLEEIKNNCNVIFICVPTPMNNDGSCNISIVESVVSEFENLSDKIIVIKSTIPLTTTNQ